MRQHILNKINRAFDIVTGSQTHTRSNDEVIAPPTVRRRRGDAALTTRDEPMISAGGGGFIPSSPPAGGFIVEDDKPSQLQEQSAATHIPLAKIPTALQILDLPPADEEVLAIFRNAAGGWNGSSDGNEGVSRKDWISVCSILLSQQDPPDASSEDELMRDGSQPQEESSADDSDGYRDPEEHDWVDEEGSGDEDGDSDDYVQPSKKVTPKKGKGKAEAPTRASKGKKRSKIYSEDEEEVPKSMTRRQKAACREAFALFFPDVEDKDLDSQRIMIKDIVRVSPLVKETITAEEVMEMLTEFSTSPDKSVSLSDFERIMMVAKLA